MSKLKDSIKSDLETEFKNSSLGPITAPCGCPDNSKEGRKRSDDDRAVSKIGAENEAGGIHNEPKINSESREKEPISEKRVLKFKTCEEYGPYLDDDTTRASEKTPPKDSLSYGDFCKKPIDEICKIVNRMSVTHNKSNLKVMYYNRYGFSWSKMQSAALAKGLKKDKEKSNTPHFYIPGHVSEEPTPTVSVEKKIIYIDHGRREDTITRKLTLSKETNEIIDSLFSELPTMERSKIIETLLRERLDEISALYAAGKIEFRYRPLAEETIHLGKKHTEE